jgi:hypothetical protein
MSKLLILAGLLLSLFTAGQNKMSADSVITIASSQYGNAGFFKRLIMGSNYREVWSQPVKLPVFHLKQQGFTIKELGGGQQTKSLQLKDSRGSNWVLRTVEKDVDKALPNPIRNTLAEKVTQDLISASHPYAAVTIPPINKALGVIAPEPRIYYVPDDPAFGEFRSLFANTVCLLEKRDPTPDNSETKNSEDLLEKILEENDHRVMQHTVLKARLVDMLIGDWDRHADQWRWGKKENDDLDLYYAVPRDRDQAYFFSNGILVKTVRHFAMKHLVGYRDNLNKLKHLNFKAWKFDGIFLNELDRNDWDSTLKWAQSQLTDELIHTAMTQMPAEAYAINGAEMERRFRGRRDDLHVKGMRYYSFISKNVFVNGSDKAEIFKVNSSKDGILIQIFDVKDDKEGRKIYERVFLPDETWRVSLRGFGGNDHFIVDPSVNEKMRMQFVGGDGNDRYEIKGGRKNTIIEKKEERNQILHKHRSRVKYE